MPVLHLDVKARSGVDLSRSGLYRYCEHSSAEVLCVTWAFGDGPIKVWVPGERCPKEIADHLKAGGAITGWNISFERLAWNRILGPRHGWPLPKLDQFNDSMAAAAALSLPRTVEGTAKVLGLTVRRDEEGQRLHTLMSMRHDEPSEGDLERLGRSAANEVEIERDLHRKLPPLSNKEREIWLLDQAVNDRGIMMDFDLVAAMLAIVEAHHKTLDRKLAVRTGGAVTSCTQIPNLQKWLAAQGVAAPGLSRNVIETLLAQAMPDHCREVLAIRHEGSKTSNHKLTAAQECTSSDGRARGLLVYHGTRTGRWSGKLWQPQNLPRGSGIIGNQGQGTAIDLIRHRRANLLEWAYDKPLTVISDCLRGVMTAAPGHHLMAGDFASIEARVTAWMARDDEKLEQFRKADRSEGPDIYRVAAAAIYNVSVDEIGDNDPRRQTGKTAELALGFQGAVKALADMAVKHHVDLAPAYESLWDAASPEQRERALERYVTAADHCGLDEKTWLTCELIVKAWRRANLATVTAWSNVGAALWKAVGETETVIEASPLAFRHRGKFLGMRLPSGRAITYPLPAKESVEAPWSEDGRQVAITVHDADGRRRPLYGGLLFQNAVQGMARDLLADAMLRLEAAGFPVVMSIHDEIICEVPQSRAENLDRFLALLCEVPAWADGLPIVAEGLSGFRYRKS